MLNQNGILLLRPGNLLSTIGVDFDDWTETNGITTTNGAVFLINPQEVLAENEKLLKSYWNRLRMVLL